jgi:alpha-glucosidase
MLALPGSAYLYEGEELGLPEVADIAPIYLQDPTWERSDHHDKGRDGCRVPLPWEPTGPSFGFSSVTAWIPQPADWAELSWGAEDGDPTSTLELYRSALALRRKFGTDEALAWLAKGPTVLSFARSNGLVCIVNFGVEAVQLPAGQLLLASSDLADGGLLPTDTAAWVLTN